VLDLPRHDRLPHAAALEGVDAASELAERDPMDLVDLAGEGGVGLFLDRHRHHPPPGSTAGRRHQERETAVAGDEPQGGRTGLGRAAHQASSVTW
jgi:hypothetical protein